MKRTSLKDLKNFLLRNTKLTVSQTDREENVFYDSRIEDIDSRGILISMPTRAGEPIPVRPGSGLHISAIVSDGRIAFDSKVTGVEHSPVYMLRVEHPARIRHEQMRQYYRVPVRMRAGIFHGDMTQLLTYNDDAPLEEVMVDDLSGGGCKILVSKDYRIGDTVVVDFGGSPLADIGMVTSKVVRKSRSASGRKEVSLRFGDIDENNRDKIIRYVFRRQLELRNLKD